MGIDTPLVDSEGYPRGDIDVFRARTLRKRFIEIQNDHKSLTRKIEKGLVELQAISVRFAYRWFIFIWCVSPCNAALSQKDKQQEDEERALRTAPKPKPKFDPITGQWVVKSWDGSVAGVKDGENRKFHDLLATTDGSNDNSAVGNDSVNSIIANETNNASASTHSSEEATPTTTTQQTTQILTPFALIDEVSPNSPASMAGIQVNDELLQFDTINATNHENFSAIAKLLPEKEEKEIRVKVRRRREMDWGEVYEVKELILKPRKWEGRGLLGCHNIITKVW